MDRTPARYDEVADFYEDFAPDEYTNPPTSALLDVIGEVTGLRLLDMACGHGRVTRELSRHGARVTGLDISAALLDKARRIELQNPWASPTYTPMLPRLMRSRARCSTGLCATSGFRTWTI